MRGLLLVAGSIIFLVMLSPPLASTASQVQLILEAYNWLTPGTGLILTIRNVGTTNLIIADTFVNGVATTAALGGVQGCNSPSVGSVPVQTSCTLTIVGYATITNGVAYSVKIVTADGTVFLFSAIAGQASDQPQTIQTLHTATQTPTANPTDSVTLTIPPRYNYYFWVYVYAGQSLDFSFAGSSTRGADEVGFTIVSSRKSVLIDVGRVKQYSGSFTPTVDGNYSLTFDNSFSLLTTKSVVVQYHIRSSLGPSTFPQQTGSTSTNPAGLSGDTFVKNAFTMLAVVTVGIFLVGAVLGLHALLIVRPRNRGLYGDEPERRTRVRPNETSRHIDESRVVEVRTRTGGESSSVITMLAAVVASALLVVSAFMPWLTIDFPFGSRIPLNLADFLSLVDFSTRNAGAALQTIQSSLALKAIPPSAVVVRDTVFFLLLATVLYSITMVAAVMSFVFKHWWLAFSGIFAIVSALLGLMGIQTLKGTVMAEDQTPAYALLIHPDFGIYLTLIAGFAFLGAYFMTRQSVLVEERVVAAPTMKCTRCGAETPTDSKFCKQCGTRVDL